MEARLWGLAESLLPEADIQPYTQGLMDLGATVCTRHEPRCDQCPFSSDCLALSEGRTRELPGARPKKTVPEKSVTMLVLRCHSEVLLEKRPPAGIWGGLWSLPECREQEEPVQAARRLGYLVDAPVRLLPFAHAFTHFRLSIHPWMLDVRAGTRIAEPGQVWLALDDLAGAALPAPVRRILDGLRS